MNYVGSSCYLSEQTLWSIAPKYKLCFIRASQDENNNRTMFHYESLMRSSRKCASPVSRRFSFLAGNGRSADMPSMPSSDDATKAASAASAATEAMKNGESKSNAGDLNGKIKERALVNLNTASVEDISKLPGIGPV
jgi:hypothetical protein